MEERRDYSVGDESEESLHEGEGKAAETPLGAAASIAEELAMARAESADWRDKYLRKAAEFDNFRKRTRQESAMLRQIVSESLLVSLLPVMDDFDRMLSVPGDSNDPVRRGAELVRDKLRAFFDGQGVVKTEAIGKPFDPEEHDALATRPTPGFPAGTVLDVITPGYRLGDRILRHAQVVVSADETESPDLA